MRKSGLVTPGNGDRPGLEAVVRRQRQQGGMEPDRIIPTFQHGGLQIVVQQHPWHRTPGIKGGDMTAQKALHALIEVEAQKDAAAEAEHHHEGHQRSSGTANLNITKVTPVDLRFLTG